MLYMHETDQFVIEHMVGWPAFHWSIRTSLFTTCTWQQMWINNDWTECKVRYTKSFCSHKKGHSHTPPAADRWTGTTPIMWPAVKFYKMILSRYTDALNIRNHTVNNSIKSVFVFCYDRKGQSAVNLHYCQLARSLSCSGLTLPDSWRTLKAYVFP